MITAAEQRSRGRGRRPFFVTPTFGPKGIARRHRVVMRHLRERSPLPRAA